MLNPQYPAAVVAGNVETSQAVTDALYGALNIMSASQVCVQSHRHAVTQSHSHSHAVTGTVTVTVVTIAGTGMQWSQ
eukprot:4806608-Pyramimonas_sp.AAC.1